MNTPDNLSWMVLYTRSKWEKKVDQLLKVQGIESYCPLVKTTKKWADRSKIVEIPLFSSYLFVHANVNDLDKILQTTGVVTYVNFCGKPAIINNNEMENIKSIVNQYPDLQTIPLSKLLIGDDAVITAGPLINQTGKVQKVNGRSIVMVIESMNCALTVRIDLHALSAISPA